MLAKLEGYKTYITAVLLLVANLGVQFGWFTQEIVSVANAVLGPLGLAFLRDGISKAEKATIK